MAATVMKVRERFASRDPWLDNARLLAAVLIALMHVLGRAGLREDESSIIYGVWLATFPMRVPLFVLVAGYFSSAAPLTGRGAVNLVRNILGVYLSCWLIVTVVDGVSGAGWVLAPHQAPFALWFLLSLFFWRLLLPLLAHVRYLAVFAIAAALTVGFVDGIGHAFSASRSITLFPIFLLGWYLRRVGARSLVDHRLARPVGLVVFLLVTAMALTAGRTIPSSQYSLARTFSGTASEQLLMAAERAGILLLGVVGALAVLAMVPRRRLPVITYLGTGSMYIYVLHALTLRLTPLSEQQWFAEITGYGPVLLLVLCTVAVSLGFASPPVRKALGWLIQPKYTWLFREPPATPSLSRQGAR